MAFTQHPTHRPKHGRAALCGCTLALLLAAPGCDGDAKPGAQEPPPPEVGFVHPARRNVTSHLEYTGNTQALATAQLQARVQGFLEQINFVEGGLVHKGDLLFVIEKSQYQAAVDKAAAELQAAEAALAGAEADAQLAAELASQQAGPEIDRIIKAARRDAAAATVAEAHATLARAQIDLDYCEVRSPIDGRIGSRQVDIGNLVGRGETTLLATVYQVAPIYVTVAVSESDLLAARRRALEAGRTMDPADPAAADAVPVYVSLADEENFKTRGRIDYIDPTVDRQTGTIGVRLVFDNSDNLLIPGLFVRVRFDLETSEQMLVPQQAILQDQTGQYVLLVDDQGVVGRKRVKVGQTDGADRVVEEGLDLGDRVIVSGQLKARPGTVVSAQPAEPGAEPVPAADSGN